MCKNRKKRGKSLKTFKNQMNKSIQKAEELWEKVKKTYTANPNLIELPQEKKVDLFYKDNEEFYKEFPLVSRYMIVHGQYDRETFIYYLKMKYYDSKNIPAEREKDYIENKWIKREAEYIQGLWKKAHKRKVDEAVSKAFLRETIKELKNEFDTFRKRYDEVKTDIEIKEKKNNIERIKEINEKINKISSPGMIGGISTNEEIKLKENLRDRLLLAVYAKNYKILMFDLKMNTKEIPPVCEDCGKNIMSDFDTIQYVYEAPVMRMHQLKFNPVLAELIKFKN